MHYKKSLALVIAVLLVLLIGFTLYLVTQKIDPQSEPQVIKETNIHLQGDKALQDQIVETITVGDVIPEYKAYSKDEMNAYIDSLGPEKEALKLFLQQEIKKYDQ